MSNEDSLKQILICKLCNESYQDPIILPCGKSICSKHINTEEIEGNIFKCLLCGKKHAIPMDGFCKNDELNRLIKISDKYVNIDDALGVNNEKASQLCANLEEILNKSELLSTDPNLFVYEYFSKLKSDLDLNREQCIKMINDNYHDLLKEIEEAETKCRLNINKLETSISKLNESIKRTKDKHVLLVNSAKSPKLNSEIEWSYYETKIQHAISKSNYMIKKFQSELLLNTSLEFKLKPILNENNFGNLVITNDYFPSENRLEGTIKFELDQFKLFKFKKLNRFDRDWCVVDNIRWTALAYVEEKNDYDLFLELFAKPDLEKLVSPIRSKITFKLMKENGTIYKMKSFEFTFEDALGRGYDFCSVKEIVDPKNQVYDKKNDSIRLEVDIQILK